jgi:hypothetical protein
MVCIDTGAFNIEHIILIFFSLQEALLHQKCDKRRLAVAEGVNYRPPTFPRCHVPTPDGRCNQRVLPLSRMCFDRNLFLFQGFTFLSRFRSYVERAISRYWLTVTSIENELKKKSEFCMCSAKRNKVINASQREMFKWLLHVFCIEKGFIIIINIVIIMGWNLAEWSESCTSLPKVPGSSPSGGSESFCSDLLLTWAPVVVACLLRYPGNTLSQRLEPPSRAG